MHVSRWCQIVTDISQNLLSHPGFCPGRQTQLPAVMTSFIVHHASTKELCNHPKAVGALLELGEELVRLLGSSLQGSLDAEGLPKLGSAQRALMVIFTQAARIVRVTAQEMDCWQLQWPPAQRILAVLKHLGLQWEAGVSERHQQP